MSKTFPLQVLRIDETIFNGDAISVTAPGSTGELTILAEHETMLSSLQKGELSIRTPDNKEQRIQIEHGFIEATNRRVVVLL